MLPRALVKRWQIHEQTQRGLVRTFFLCLAVIPTLFVLATTLWHWTPWYHRSLANHFANLATQQTGLLFQFDELKCQAPSHYQVKNLKGFDPETGRELLRLRWMEVKLAKEGWEIQVANPELQSEQLGPLWKLLHDRVLCSPSSTLTRVRLTTKQLTLLPTSGKPFLPSLSDFQIGIRRGENETKAVCSFLSINDTEGEAIQVELDRQHLAAIPSTRIAMDTHQHQLPLSLLADLFPVLHTLGPSATFEGKLIAEYNMRGEWQYQQLANLRSLQLETLTAWLPYRMTGVCDWKSSELFIQNSRVRTISGEVQNQTGGTLTKEFMFQLNPTLGIVMEQDTHNTLAKSSLLQIKYDFMDFDFRMNEVGLEVNGRIPSRHDNKAILGKDDELLLFERNKQDGRMPMVSLGKFVSLFASSRPNPETSISDSQAVANWLIPYLPLDGNGVAPLRVSQAAGTEATSRR